MRQAEPQLEDQLRLLRQLDQLALGLVEHATAARATAAATRDRVVNVNKFLVLLDDLDRTLGADSDVALQRQVIAETEAFADAAATAAVYPMALDRVNAFRARLGEVVRPALAEASPSVRLRLTEQGLL